MKVLLVAPSLLPWDGGVPFSVSSLGSQLSRFTSIQILCRRGKIDYAFLKSQGVKNCREFFPKEVFAALFQRQHWLRNLISQNDIVHFNGFWRWEELLLAQLCRELGVPYVLQPRGMLLVGHRKLWLKRAYNVLAGQRMVQGAAAIIALSQFEVDEHFKEYAISADRVFVIPNGIPKISSERERDRYRVMGSAVAPMGKAPYFLYFGRIEGRKNLGFLLEAFQAYLNEGGQTRLVLVGPVEHRHDRVIRRKIRALGLEKVVQLRPPAFEDDKWTYIENSLAVVYPAVQESFGRVPFEAISAHVYPVIPDQSGSSEYLRTFLPECIYRRGDKSSFVKCLQVLEKKCVAKDFKSLEQAQQWVHQELSWERVVEKVFAVYEVVCPKLKIAHPRFLVR